MDCRAIIVLLSLSLTQAQLVQMTCKEIKKFVDGHNIRRLQLAEGKVPGQPAAAEMNSVVWDEELATKAAKWASKNKFKHNPNQTLESNRFTVGENIHMSSTTNPKAKLNIDSALKSWFSEHKDFKYKKLTRSDFQTIRSIGHYTQMVWSESTYIGCGASQFQNNLGWNSFLVVCNYGPSGNFLHQVPYRAGPPSYKLTCGVSNCSLPYGEEC